jgi:nucleoside-diphosphate-sugar epimerase
MASLRADGGTDTIRLMVSRKPAILVTGANGEIGHTLIRELAQRGGLQIVALDLKEPAPELRGECSAWITGDILDRNLLERLVTEYEIHGIFHLAALLSTRSEFSPETAHQVNVQGTLNLLKLAVEQSRWHGARVKFLFPSSIAVYGLPDAATRERSKPLTESEWTMPATMYGCNKLYCEHLGRYYAKHYRQLAAEDDVSRVDFRCIRFPGLISADTVPSGGTSDYGPEMIHAAAQGKPYSCFVREDIRLPFMAMPDATDALLLLLDAPAERLTTPVYNINAFNPSAGEFADLVRTAFPDAEISFSPDVRRQAIVEAWPAAVDDARARRDWGFAPRYDLRRTFDEYLVPKIRRRYASPRG